MTTNATRRVLRSSFAATIAVGLLATFGAARPAASPAPPPRIAAPIEVTITEGTNVAAAVSPDGSTLALDLLGRIWVLPASGGAATPLTDEFGDARQPTWSPDGSTLAFQAYWDGNYHIWTVGADGSGLRQHTFGPWDDREPHWSPAAGRIAFSSDRGGSYDVWTLEVASGRMTRVTDDPGNEYGPAWGPEGDRLAFVTDGDGPAVAVLERDGSTRRAAETDGPTSAPSWSPDGERIAYQVVADGRAHLDVVAVDGGDPETVSGDDEDVFPFRVSWTSPSEGVYTADGQLKRGRLGGSIERIPFSATVTLDRPVYRRASREFDDPGPWPVRGIVSPEISPDGRTVAFVALGDLWTMEIGAEPVRLTDDVYVEAGPTWSPDGTTLAYSSERDGARNLWVRDVSTGATRQVTTDGGLAATWSPDGTRLAYVGGAGPRGGVRVLDVVSGEVTPVRSGLNGPGRPSWAPDGRSLVLSALQPYSTRFREGVNRALLLQLDAPVSEEQDGDGGVAGRPQQAAERFLDILPHASIGSRGDDGPVWSPDGRSMAFVAAGLLWTVPVGADGDPVGPPRRRTNELADDPSWTGDSRHIVYLANDGLRRLSLLDGSVEEIPVDLTWERHIPTGRVVVHAGRLFDGVSDRARRDVDVVVQGNRIVRVAAHDAALHDGVEVVDASGRTVMPGLIEMHAHRSSSEARGRQWLSYGVTTVREPAVDPFDAAERKESSASGRRVAPRVFHTGGTIDGSRIYYPGAPALTSTAQVELALDRAEALDYDLMKTYVRLPDPVQKRVVGLSHALGLPVTSHELYPAVAYGVDGVEHVQGTSRRGYSPKVTEIRRTYGDVIELLARSGMTITPTVGIYGAFRVQATDTPEMFDDPRVRAFFPAYGEGRGFLGVGAGSLEVQRKLTRDMARTARRVVEAGGVVIAGTDSPIIPGGLALHAELDAYVRYGDMDPADALRSATSVAAEALGHGAELGRVAPGYLADLIVVEGDPLADITSTRRVEVVLRNGTPHRVADLVAGPAG